MLLVFVFVSCGDSGTATPEVIAEATQNMLCVTAGGSSLAHVEASSDELEPALVFRDTEDGLTFNPPWSGDARGERDGLRCYSLWNLDPIPDELMVNVGVGAVSIDLAVPLEGSDLSLFGAPLECTTLSEWEYDGGNRFGPATVQVREMHGSIEAPPGTRYTLTKCDEYSVSNGEVLVPGCRSWPSEMNESGRVGLLCSQERTRPDGRIEGTGKAFYVRFDE